MPGTARQSHEQQVHYLRKMVTYNDAGLAAGVLVGTLPAGALISAVRIHIATAFNAGTANNLLVGSTAGAADLASSADSAAGTVGSKQGTAVNAIGAPFANDTDVFVTFTQTGTAASAGVGYVTVSYIPNNDR